MNEERQSQPMTLRQILERIDAGQVYSVVNGFSNEDRSLITAKKLIFKDGQDILIEWVDWRLDIAPLIEPTDPANNHFFQLSKQGRSVLDACGNTYGYA